MQLGRFIAKNKGLRVAIVIGTLAAALVAVGIAAAGPAVPTPTINSQPPDPTNQVSAHFTYSDSQAGVTYQCQLDGSGYSTCPSTGITYAGPLGDGAHTFKVEAVSGSKVSPAATYTWTVDTTPPSVSLAFPQTRHTYREENWNGCPGAAGLCGAAKDTRNGVASVVVSIQQENGKWWGGSSFNKTSEFFNTASLTSAGASSTEWSYPLSLPEDGSYIVHVRATDTLGNTTAEGSQLSTTFKIDSTPPPPVLTSFPPQQATATTATFAFTDEETGVVFRCKLDGKPFASCKSPKSYTALALGSHTFSVVAKDKSRTNLSTVTTYSWTIVKKTVEEQPFTISGAVSAPLAPGVSRSLPLTVSNPNGVAIIVTSLVVTAQPGSTKAGCDGPGNLQLTQSNVSGTNTFTVPANGEVTLPSGGVSTPQVLMKNLATNQDACKGASFTFSYSGSAHS